MKTMQLQRLERYEKRKEWKKALDITKKLLAASPDSHWLLTRLGTHYHELFRYRTALKYCLKALALAPHCPLVLWDYAGTLSMLERRKEARKIYKRLLRRGVERIAFGECGEGRRWAQGLLADCRYRLAIDYAEEGKKKLAVRYLRGYLDMKRPGLLTIYSSKVARKKLAALERQTTSHRQI